MRYHYVWLACEPSGVRIRLGNGLDQSTVFLEPMDIGTGVSVIVRAENEYGQAGSMSDCTEPVFGKPRKTGKKPTIEGQPIVGHTLTAKLDGSFIGAPILHPFYRWLVCEPNGGCQLQLDKPGELVPTDHFTIKPYQAGERIFVIAGVENIYGWVNDASTKTAVITN